MSFFGNMSMPDVIKSLSQKGRDELAAYTKEVRRGERKLVTDAFEKKGVKKNIIKEVLKELPDVSEEVKTDKNPLGFKPRLNMKVKSAK